jgi:hypothetical protein
MNRAQKVDHIKGWELRKGKGELLRHLEGGKQLTRADAIAAKCYDCMGGYPEGAEDCRCEDCPLYDFMPYRVGGPRKTRQISDAQKAKLRAGAAQRISSQNKTL